MRNGECKMRSDEAEVGLPGSHRNVFQGDEGKVVDGQNAGGRRGRLGVSRTALHVLERGSCQY